jgi:hypothetical protein
MHRACNLGWILLERIPVPLVPGFSIQYGIHRGNASGFTYAVKSVQSRIHVPIGQKQSCLLCVSSRVWKPIRITYCYKLNETAKRRKNWSDSCMWVWEIWTHLVLWIWNISQTDSVSIMCLYKYKSTALSTSRCSFKQFLAFCEQILHPNYGEFLRGGEKRKMTS